MYSSRDELLTTYFSEDFSGFTGGGDTLVKDREEWVKITRQDFAQVKDPLRIELKDLAIQSLAETVAIVTGFFTIHLPIEDHILSRETARLVLVFHLESTGWKISHSSISIPYYLVREGEVYPLKELEERNQRLEEQIVERTVQLSDANAKLQFTNEKLEIEITERKLAEEESRLDRAAAEEANKAKSQFLASMSHEIRTPLNTLVGFSTLARSETDPAKLEQYHGILEQSSRSLMDLVNDILDMSKIEVGRMEFETVPVNLRLFVASLESIYRSLANQKMLEFMVIVADTVPVWIACDPVRLRQVLANLFDNAVKFTECGEVNCTISASDHGVGAGRSLIRFEIRDTGIGIPESARDLLFQPFRQLDPTITRKFGGTGLGLAIVHSLVGMMKGNITVDSREGMGSSFVIELPLQKTEPLPVEKLSALVSLVPRSILIIEDNAYNRRLLGDILMSWRQQITLAEDGLQALLFMEQHRFDLVLLDIRMPGIDGIEVARRIRLQEQQRSDVPVPIIAITADIDPATRNACFFAGINEVLPKPVIPEQLARAIATYCGQTDADMQLLSKQTCNDLGSNPGRSRQYREMLQRDILDELTCLKAALKCDDRAELVQTAHTLKGLCGHLADREPSELASWLQQNAPYAQHDELRHVVEKLVKCHGSWGM
jgi:signal transduction histidine kinase/DNA-binding response OmpR family regulator